MVMRKAATLIELLVVIAIVGTVLSILLPAVLKARAASVALQCRNNLRQIVLALHNHHSVHSSFPPGVSVQSGRAHYPFMSWIARLLPFLENEVLWREIIGAYELDPNFLHLPPHDHRATVVPTFGCPADRRVLYPSTQLGAFQAAFTSYLGVSGRNCEQNDGTLYADSRTRLADILDGASNTLIVGERPPSADEILGWWYAGWGQSQDGSADMVLGVAELNVSTYGPGCERGPYQLSQGDISNQCDAFHFWSLHSGGANFAFADGSVRLLNYSAAPIMIALASRAGGEVVVMPD
jgi:prepilin-type processing-associated H-X9-DG protein